MFAQLPSTEQQLPCFVLGVSRPVCFWKHKEVGEGTQRPGDPLTGVSVNPSSLCAEPSACGALSPRALLMPADVG